MAIGFVYQSVDDRNHKLFMKNYAEAKTFFDEYGHFPTVKENKRLNGWARYWWRNVYLKNPELYQEKADMLTAIGFVYQLVDERNGKLWMKNYAEAQVFFEEHGHFPKQKENKKLYGWAYQWWKNTYLKNPELYQDKADMLISIGFKYNGKK